MSNTRLRQHHLQRDVVYYVQTPPGRYGMLHEEDNDAENYNDDNEKLEGLQERDASPRPIKLFHTRSSSPPLIGAQEHRTSSFRKAWLTGSLICVGLGSWGFRRHITGVWYFLYMVGSFVLVLGVLTITLLIVSIRRENEATLEAKVTILHHEVIQNLKTNGHAVIVHMRDDLSGGDSHQVWQRVEQRIASDSRIRTHRELIAGEEQRVWKWIDKTSFASPSTTSRSKVTTSTVNDDTNPTEPVNDNQRLFPNAW